MGQRRKVYRSRPARLKKSLDRMNRFPLTWYARLATLGAPAFAVAVVTILTACASTTETKQDDKIYKAYGDTWVYSKTEISTRYTALDSPHGILGPRYRDQERHLIRSAEGKTITISDSLYALQRDGTLKKIKCCEYFREKGDLYNIGDRLVFIFDNAREFITDCFIYPSRRPNNELEPSEKRIYGVTVFAEFDPEANVFKIRTFNAGDNYLPFEYRAALLRSGRRDLTAQQHYASVRCDANDPDFCGTRCDQFIHGSSVELRVAERVQCVDGGRSGGKGCLVGRSGRRSPDDCRRR